MTSTANGLKWSAIERLATQSIQLIVMLYLAKLLGPNAFGLVGMLAVFIAISQVFVDSGFSSALIRYQERTEIDYSTTFYFNILVGLFCYGVLFFISPYVADFFKQPELVILLRALGVVVIINSFAIVQRAKLTIAMDFKTQTKASLISVFISCGVAIYLAKTGYGVWALVGQTLTHAICNVILLNIFLKWVPTTGFSKKSFDYLFGFGSKLLAAGLLEAIFQNIYQIIIGMQFNANQVGLFTQANRLTNVPAMTLTSVIQRVTYPMLSKMQNDEEKFDKTYLLTLRMAAVVVFPIMVGLGMTAMPLIAFILGEQWLPAAELLTILSFASMLYPIHAINLNLLQVKGRSDIFLKLEFIKKGLIICILFITIPLGIKAMCIGILVHSYIAFFINSFYAGKFSKLKASSQIKALFPIWFGTFCCASLSYAVSLPFSYTTGSSAEYDLIVRSSSMLFFYVIFLRLSQPDLYVQTMAFISKKN